MALKQILVPIKVTIDYQVRVRVRSDGKGVETEGVKMAVNPFDEIALEAAIQLREAEHASSVHILTIGPKSNEEGLRHGLALGADTAQLIETEGQRLSPRQVAKILKAEVQEKKADLVIMGKQAIDDDANQTGQMLAGFLEWPQATFASKIDLKAKDKLHVTREVDGGLEEVSLSLPAVVTTDLRLNTPRFASLPNIMKARQKPLEHKLLSDFKDVDLTPAFEVQKVTPPPVRGPAKMVEDVETLMKEIGL